MLRLNNSDVLSKLNLLEAVDEVAVEHSEDGISCDTVEGTVGAACSQEYVIRGHKDSVASSISQVVILD